MKQAFPVLIFVAVYSLSTKLSAGIGIRISSEPGQQLLGWGMVVSDELIQNLVVPSAQDCAKKTLIFLGMKQDIVGIGIEGDYPTQMCDDFSDNGKQLLPTN